MALTDDVGPLDAVAVAFVRLLRRRGLDVALHSCDDVRRERSAEVGMVDRILGVLGRAAPRWCTDPRTVDRVRPRIRRVLAAARATNSRLPPRPSRRCSALDDGSDEDEDSARPVTGRSPTFVVRFSRLETLRDKDFAACTPAELTELHRRSARLRLSGSLRRSRRLRPTHRRTAGPTSAGRSGPRSRTGGEPIHRRYRAPIERPRRLVLLVDVSGSMEPYATSTHAVRRTPR